MKDRTEVSAFLEKVKEASVPFSPEDHDWKPLSISEKGAWIAYYVDMRKMMERLQRVFGDTASVHVSALSIGEGGNGYNVLATLTISSGENTVTYQDFGYASPEAMEGLKSASTDAYRRVLSHVGIGRYLYHLPRVFIGGRKNGYRFVPKRNPIEVLRELLENPTTERFVFFDAEEDDATVPAHRKSEDVATTGRSSGGRNGKRSSQWFEMFGVDNHEDAVRFLRDVAKRRGASYTEKQISAFLNMVDPSETSLTSIEEDPTVIKSLLDRAFAKLRK